ncbi:MAG: CPBP family intramembrane glutamic endopeptidase [Gammaproteobacteria bacterium]
MNKDSAIAVVGGLVFFTVLIGMSQGIVAVNVAVSPAVPWFPLAAIALVGAAVAGANRLWSLRLNVPATGRAYAAAILLNFSVLCFGVIEFWWNDVATPAPTWPDDTLSAGFQLAYLFTLPVVAAVLAEIGFRGVIQTALEKVWSHWPVIFAIAVLNLLMHFYDPDQFKQVFRLIALNIVWGWITWRTGSIRPALAAHVAMNIGIAALQVWMENYGPGPLEFGSFRTSTVIIWAVIGSVTLAAGLALCRSPFLVSDTKI